MSRPTRWAAAPPHHAVLWDDAVHESLLELMPAVILRDLLARRGVPGSLLALLIEVRPSLGHSDAFDVSVDDRLPAFVRWLGAESFSTAARFRWHHIAGIVNRQPDFLIGEKGSCNANDD